MSSPKEQGSFAKPDFSVSLAKNGAPIKTWRLHRAVLIDIPYYETWFNGPFGDSGTSTLETDLVGSAAALDHIWHSVYTASETGLRYEGQPNDPPNKTLFLSRKDSTSKDAVATAAAVVETLKPCAFLMVEDTIAKTTLSDLQSWLLGEHRRESCPPSYICHVFPILVENMHYGLEKICRLVAEKLSADPHLLWKRPVLSYDDDTLELLFEELQGGYDNWKKMQILRRAVKNSPVLDKWNDLLHEAENAIVLKSAQNGELHDQVGFLPGRSNLGIGCFQRDEVIAFYRRMGTPKRKGGVLDRNTYNDVQNCLSFALMSDVGKEEEVAEIRGVLESVKAWVEKEMIQWEIGKILQSPRHEKQTVKGTRTRNSDGIGTLKTSR